MSGQKRTVKDFMRKHIVLFIILMLLCVFLNNIVTSFVTAPFEDSVPTANLLLALCKYATALIPLLLMVKWNLVQKSGVRKVLIGILLGIPNVLLIAGNLLPFSLISPASYKVQWLSVLAIIVAYFGVGLMEEAACRGVLLPLLCEKWSDRKNGCMKAALFSSALFGFAHFSWIINALVFHGTVSIAECVGRLYQVYYAFCFGMLCAGVTLCARSIIPMVIWHALVDISAFIGQGILYPTAYQYYFELNPVGFDTLLVQKGIVRDAGFLSWALPIGMDAVLLLAGILMVRRSKCSFEKGADHKQLV
ncbi:MAG: CPBP family intramembrane metalloprotease [Oscillospiraceae bacterium]|nr:CPBP family intramembrane metalloprotease [Oscillospiraceae bacterium]